MTLKTFPRWPQRWLQNDLKVTPGQLQGVPIGALKRYKYNYLRLLELSNVTNITICGAGTAKYSKYARKIKVLRLLKLPKCRQSLPLQFSIFCPCPNFVARSPHLEVYTPTIAASGLPGAFCMATGNPSWSCQYCKYARKIKVICLPKLDVLQITPIFVRSAFK